MAVPKRKKSKSRSKMRKAANGSRTLNIPNVIVDKTTGEWKLSHNISVDGYYKGRKIIADKIKKEKAPVEDKA